MHSSTMQFPADASLLLALCISSLFLLLVFKKSIWKNRNFPPGPTPLPILGNILQLKGDYVKTLIKFRETYGDVCTIYLGSRPVILVTGYKAVKEVLVDKADDFLARGEMPAFDSYYKNYGLIFTSDMNRWRQLRRFSLSALRDFGMGKKSLEEKIQEEAACLVKELQKMEEAFFDPGQCLSKPPCNIIFSIMFGNRQKYDDEELLNVIEYVHKSFLVVCSPWGQLFEMFPGVMKFIPGPHQTISEYLGKLQIYVEKRVEMNEKTLDPANPRDYVDTFLIKMKKEKKNPQSEFSLRNLVYSTLQIFFAGVETISSVLAYSLLILLKNPDIIAKVQEEIDRVIGRDRCPTLQDRSQMPYTDTVMHEMLRFIDLIPLGVPRKTTKDTELQGYTIPKGTNVFPVLSSVLKDRSCFPYPSEFNPQNFQDENGEFKKNDAFMPLSAGKRVCLGEGLVRMELFLFLITILQNFKLKSPVPPEELDITPHVSGLGNLPKPYKISFVPR
ncbi:cytochrome P450 2G1-like [Pelobates fuscus]|uniref:cytochrome P450 2G1-like n=1 Tax=Pelobates fuscus TaxID=191477 RepID=UPI002FE484F5